MFLVVGSILFFISINRSWSHDLNPTMLIHFSPCRLPRASSCPRLHHFPLPPSPLPYPHILSSTSFPYPPKTKTDTNNPFTECVDVLSECSDQPNNEELEILEEEDEEDEEEEEEEDDLTPTNSVKAAFSPNRRNNQHQRSNHDRESRTNQDRESRLSHPRTNHRDEDDSASSSIGVGVGANLGQGPEDYLLTGANSGVEVAPSHRHAALEDNELLHLNHRSPARQGSLNDSDGGNQDTIHSTEKLIHV